MNSTNFSPFKWLAGAGMCAFLAGCAGPAPNYIPSIDNVELLKKKFEIRTELLPLIFLKWNRRRVTL